MQYKFIIFFCFYFITFAHSLTGQIKWNTIPIANAEIKLKSTQAAVKSDSLGRYIIDRPLKNNIASLSQNQSAFFRINADQVEFKLVKTDDVLIELFSARGQYVRTLFHSQVGTEKYNFSVTHSLPKSISSGIYNIRFSSSQFNQSISVRIGSEHQSSLARTNPISKKLVKVNSLLIDSLHISAFGFKETTIAIYDTAHIDTIILSKKRNDINTSHLWIWGDEVIQDSASRDSLFVFAKAKNITKFYVESQRFIDSPLIESFILESAQNLFETEILFGSEKWSLEANHQIAIDLATKSVALATRLQSESKPTLFSIQFDIEPHALHDWSSNTNSLGTQLIQLYEKINFITKNSPIKLSACIPRWYDQIMIHHTNKTRPLSEWIADLSDRITLMDYVDTSPIIIEDASQEIAYAEKAGKEVTIGVEVTPGILPETVTFAEEGEAFMNAELSKVVAAHKNSPAFAGIAIHEYNTYKKMAP